MKLQYVRIIAAIADAGSINGAAQRLEKTQPAVTKALRQAENELGFAIFRRIPQGVEATELGQAVITRARSIYAEYNRLEEEIDQIKGGQRGVVDICVSPLAAVQIVPQAMALFRKRYPGVKVNITSGMFPRAYGPLREGQTDMVIGPLPDGDPMRSLTVEPLAEARTAMVTSQASPYANATSLTDLLDAQWILVGPLGGGGNIFEKAFRMHGLTPPESVTTCESYFGALSIVASLKAVCNFPLKLIESHGDAWGIRAIPLAEDIPSVMVNLVTVTGRPMTPATDHLANCIRRRADTLVREQRKAA